MEIALWGRSMSSDARQALYRRRNRFRRAWQVVFTDFTAVLLPVMAVPALPARDPNIPVLADETYVSGVRMPLFALSMWCAVASVGGMPAVSMPLASPTGGLPVGLQVIAAPNRDAELLTLVADIAGVVDPRVADRAAS
jgi:Asp-tRNA(Asn)/Glu-tRNA(Gln) amidotransferase A subunit family amidase